LKLINNNNNRILSVSKSVPRHDNAQSAHKLRASNKKRLTSNKMA